MTSTGTTINLSTKPTSRTETISQHQSSKHIQLANVAEMIARVWKGWTKAEDANAYEKLLREVVYPGLQKINGYRGGYILRKDGKDETEFVTVNLFGSLEAVKAFAGPEYETPVFEPEARRLLSRVEPIARHYDVIKGPQL